MVDKEPVWKLTKTWIVSGPTTREELVSLPLGEPDSILTERVDSPYCVGSGLLPVNPKTRVGNYLAEIDYQVPDETRGECPKCDNSSVLVNEGNGRLRKHPAVDR